LTRVVTKRNLRDKEEEKEKTGGGKVSRTGKTTKNLTNGALPKPLINNEHKGLHVKKSPRGSEGFKSSFV